MDGILVSNNWAVLNIVILVLTSTGGGSRSIFTMEEMDSDLIENVLSNLRDEEIIDLTNLNTVNTTSSSTTATTTAQHFRDDPLIPIYSAGNNRPFSSKNVAEEILNGVSTHLISSLVPHQPNENIAFVIGTQYLGHWKDMLSDNLGSWKNDGTKSLYYSTFHKLSTSREIKLKPSSDEDATVLVTRYLYVYPSSPSFKRVVVTVSVKIDNKWELKSPVFVQYYFTNVETVLS